MLPISVNDVCAGDPKTRTKCPGSYAGIKAAACRQLGCCWSSKVRKVFFCFEIRREFRPMMLVVWEVTRALFVNFSVKKLLNFANKKYLVGPLICFHIWRVSPQLSCNLRTQLNINVIFKTQIVFDNTKNWADNGEEKLCLGTDTHRSY